MLCLDHFPCFLALLLLFGHYVLFHVFKEICEPKLLLAVIPLDFDQFPHSSNKNIFWRLDFRVLIILIAIKAAWMLSEDHIVKHWHVVSRHNLIELVYCKIKLWQLQPQLIDLVDVQDKQVGCLRCACITSQLCFLEEGVLAKDTARNAERVQHEILVTHLHICVDLSIYQNVNLLNLFTESEYHLAFLKDFLLKFVN